jgi:hypothetical protein
MNKFEKIIESNSHTVYANTQARVNVSIGEDLSLRAGNVEIFATGKRKANKIKKALKNGCKGLKPHFWNTSLPALEGFEEDKINDIYSIEFELTNFNRVDGSKHDDLETAFPELFSCWLSMYENNKKKFSDWIK